MQQSVHATDDVDNTVHVTEAVEKAREAFGEIDVLVNNAGYGYFGTQEEGELDEIRAMYETNVFGLIRMTQAVIPHMRARRAGTIMNLSSIAGNIGTPRAGFYQSTKWAVEAARSLTASTWRVAVTLVALFMAKSAPGR